jgi:GT2 family glycosyltransferase
VIDLSVVIASYESAELLPACLAALARAQAASPGLRCEVIVVDNGSRDESLRSAREARPPVRTVALARNLGFAAAVNLGLRLRRGRHVLLLNSDAEIEADVLARAVATLDAEPSIGVLGAGLRHRDGRIQRSVHAIPGLASELLPDTWLRGLRGLWSSNAVPSGDLREVEAVRGAVFFVSDRALAATGELDAGYFFFLEETDYCDRVRATGLRVVHAPALRATHHLGASSKARAPLATRIEYERSLDRFLRRSRGPCVAGAVRGVRVLRALLGLLVSVPVAPLLPARSRRRIRERVGLILWHLRGRPASPTFAQALAEAPAWTGQRQ